MTLAIRSFALLLPLLGAAVAWLWLQPSPRRAGAAYLATLWTLPSLFAVHLLAQSFGWWTFHFEGGGLFGMPVDLLFGWALLWGALPALLLIRIPLPLAAGGMIALDLVFMPLCAPVVQLGPRWLVGELVAAAIVLVPAQLLARWTARDVHLGGRVLLQIVLFTGLVLTGVPAMVLALTNSHWNIAVSNIGQQVLLQLAIIAAIVGLTAVQEFAERGGGTPFPYDPPKTLVRSGIYAYVRNPMQLSASALLALIALATMNAWLATAALLTVAFSAGFAAWDEGSDLRQRFGDGVLRYTSSVRNWLPSWRPRIEQPSIIYLDMGCDRGGCDPSARSPPGCKAATRGSSTSSQPRNTRRWISIASDTKVPTATSKKASPPSPAPSSTSTSPGPSPAARCASRSRARSCKRSSTPPAAANGWC